MWGTSKTLFFLSFTQINSYGETTTPHPSMFLWGCNMHWSSTCNVSFIVPSFPNIQLYITLSKSNYHLIKSSHKKENSFNCVGNQQSKKFHLFLLKGKLTQICYLLVLVIYSPPTLSALCPLPIHYSNQIVSCSHALLFMRIKGNIWFV